MVTVGVCVQPCLTVDLLPGQTFDSIMTLDMQIFGPTLTTFPAQSQAIITEGIANFLNSGVTASQITLTVENMIAAVSHCFASNHSYHIIWSWLQLALQRKQFFTMQACIYATFRS